jgi:hypothetical protein
MGLSVQKPSPMDRRRKRRVSAHLPVRIWGVDAKAQPFSQLARVRNISSKGALVEGMLRAVKPGEVVHVQFGEEQAQFRVVWAARRGSVAEGEIGVEGLPGQMSIWDVNLLHCAEFAGKG